MEPLTRDAESLLQELELPHRVVALCAGDTGFNAAKTYDLEVWIPSSKAPIARSARARTAPTSKRAARRYAFGANPAANPSSCTTLNGSGLAIGRTLIAILENYQQPDGSIIAAAGAPSYAGFSRL